jgi:hypothetical protein
MDRDLRAQLLAILAITRGTPRASAVPGLCSEISEFRLARGNGTLLAITKL